MTPDARFQAPDDRSERYATGVPDIRNRSFVRGGFGFIGRLIL
jgi:hypothetical protein